MKKIVLVYTFLFTISFQVNAQWELQNPILTNFDITDISYADESNIIAVGENGLILHSADSGLHWEKQTHSSGNNMNSICFINPSIGFAVGNNGIITKTTDTGVTWQDINVSLTNNLYSVYFINEFKGFIGSSDGLLFTTVDGGFNWNIIQTSTNLTINEIKFVSDSIGFIKLRDLNLFSDTFLCSTDGGSTWLSFSFPLGSSSGFFLDSQIIFSSSFQGFYKSTDRGNSWNLILNSNMRSSDIYFIDQFNGYCKNSWGGSLFKTTDGGINWDTLKVTAGSLFQSYNFKMKFLDFNNGFIISKDGILLKTSNAGLSWELPISNTYLNLKRLYFLNNQVGYAGGYIDYNSEIIKTTDGGISWETKKNINYGSYMGINSIDFIDGNVGAVACDLGLIIKTIDGGETWEDIYLGFEQIIDIKLFSENTLIASSTNKVYRSTDNGISWYTTTLGERMKFDFVTNNYGYAISEGGAVYRSIDQGINWDSLSILQNANAVDAIDFLGINFGVAIASNTFYKTYDGGITWQSKYIPGFDQRFSDICFSDTLTGWIIAPKGKILKTVDGGENWTYQLSQSTSYLSAITSLTENEGWIVGENGLILHTTNGGVTFIEDEENNFAQPKEFLLQQNYPNPFNPSTKISWQSPVGSWQTLKVYDILGNEVATLVNEYRDAGSYEVEFNLASSIQNLASGIYFYKLQAGDFVETKKMIFLK